MISWFSKLMQNPTKLDIILDIYEYYNAELNNASDECKILSGRLEKHIAELPGQMEYRDAQYADLIHIKKHLDLMYDKIVAKYYKKYCENYPKDLKSNQIIHYVNSEPEVTDFAILKSQIEYLCERYSSIIKALQCKNYQISNLTKLKCAGFEGYELL